MEYLARYVNYMIDCNSSCGVRIASVAQYLCLFCFYLFIYSVVCIIIRLVNCMIDCNSSCEVKIASVAQYLCLFCFYLFIYYVLCICHLRITTIYIIFVTSFIFETIYFKCLCSGINVQILMNNKMLTF